jgi:hypothetical protein
MSQPTENQPRNPAEPLIKSRSIVESLIGEQTARQQEKYREIQLRHAASEAAHARVRNFFSTVLITVFTLALLFGMFTGCVALWNAVVG